MSKSAKKSKMGRPRLSQRGSTQLAVRFPAEIMDGIDAIVEERFGQADRTAIIRELVAEALQGRKQK
ncbi:MAG: hypothetical protein JSR99_08205 [Proteobacteria bacterium]|nr:hypothetical protein [Pseudomonadota bacterium]